MPIPTKSIKAAQKNYEVIEPLVEAIRKFQDNADRRYSCYEALKIDRPVAVIDGLDLLAADFNLLLTKRNFREYDFGYLENSDNISQKENNLEP